MQQDIPSKVPIRIKKYYLVQFLQLFSDKKVVFLLADRPQLQTNGVAPCWFNSCLDCVVMQHHGRQDLLDQGPFHLLKLHIVLDITEISNLLLLCCQIEALHDVQDIGIGSLPITEPGLLLLSSDRRHGVNLDRREEK